MNYELKQAIVKVAEKAVMNALDLDYMEECGQNAGEISGMNMAIATAPPQRLAKITCKGCQCEWLLGS